MSQINVNNGPPGDTTERSTSAGFGMMAVVLALIVAVVVIWLLFSYSAGTVSRTFEIPIEFRNLPPDWVLDSDTVPSALVTVKDSVAGR